MPRSIKIKRPRKAKISNSGQREGETAKGQPLSKKQKVWLAYWPSSWQAANDVETVIDIVFGIFTSRKNAVDTVRANLERNEWDDFRKDFRYKEIRVDEFHPIPNV